MNELVLHTVILDESIKSQPYLLNDVVQVTKMEDESIVYHMTCTSVDTSGNYLSATVSAVPNGEPRKILLRHSFVVAVLETVSLQSQLGFQG